ncbi:LpqB family beta-propeller domain-containing protein [Actinokineospora fastidiosa]|uniref:Lipoprotein n=1 Tax=Actinokineospora fastidiosa TaxID=1816 RepID=A0A918GAK5_9PSEU|nr:LpqB family beta-propeller domain-containing protein [Actinokineospora fastidiosa]GGS25665.1 lipoprotein [Actinokineospora fastidiosa]
MTRAVLALLVLASLASCATIPADTPPRVMLENPGEAPDRISGPRAGVDPFTLVQDFLDAADNIAAAKTYLTEEAAATWPSHDQPIIVQNNPTYRPEIDRGPSPDGPNPDVLHLTLGTTQIGELKPDGSFYPQVQPREDKLVVRRQADQQWRIAQPPPYQLLTKIRFEAAYRRVNLQFFDPARRVLVPDPRWVANEPSESMEARVVELLLAGPSDGLKDAVVSTLEGVQLHTNVVQDSDGAIRINLTNVEERSPEEHKQMVAQIVNSLSGVTLNKLRILDTGSALIPDRQDWQAADVPTYDGLASPKPELTGLAVDNRRVITLADGRPIEGPAGAGAYNLVSGAQSLDGSHLAVVEHVPGGARLRIGPINRELQEIPLDDATSLTRPTWMPGNSRDESGNEVWTVVNETLVVRAVRAADNRWTVFAVDASDLTRDRGRITELRLSRDGVRLAAVVNGEVKVASIVRSEESVTIRAPRTLQLGTVRSVVGLDWSERTVLVAATHLPSLPVVSMPLDGFDYTPYMSSTLSPPVTSITAAPSRPVIVTDKAGIWSTADPGKVWLSDRAGGPDSRPFYPG